MSVIESFIELKGKELPPSCTWAGWRVSLVNERVGFVQLRKGRAVKTLTEEELQTFFTKDGILFEQRFCDLTKMPYIHKI
jgi:hypothetical protein